MNKFLKIIGIILIAVVILFIALNVVLKSVVGIAIKEIAGTEASIGSLHVDWVNQKVTMGNFILYNPPGFSHPPMISITEIIIKVDVSVLPKRLHIPLMVINLKEATIEKDKAGKLNVDSLKFAQKGAKETEQKNQEMMPFQIDELHLSLGQVVVKDFARGPEPSINAYGLNVQDKVLKNINSPEQLISLILVQVMAPTALKSAAIYGVATVLSMGVLPVGVAAVLVGNDKAVAEFSQNPNAVSREVEEVLKQRGQGMQKDSAGRLFQATVDGASVNVIIEQPLGGKTKVTVSARKMFIPRPETASGIIYSLKENLK